MVRNSAKDFKGMFEADFVSSISSVTTPHLLITLAFALCIGLFIFLVYRQTYARRKSSTTIGVYLIALTVLSTYIILKMMSNLVLMAILTPVLCVLCVLPIVLSIALFRSAVRTMLDVAFLLWSIAVGVTLGAARFNVAVIGSLVIGAAALILAHFLGGTAQPYLIEMQCAGADAETLVMEYLAGHTAKNRIKSKGIQDGVTDMTVMIWLKDESPLLANGLSEIPGVRSVVMKALRGGIIS